MVFLPNSIASWTAKPTLSPQLWRPSENTMHWWINITSSEHVPRKAIRSLALLVIWEIWRERNARVFRNRETSPLGLLEKIKSEAAAWVAGLLPVQRPSRISYCEIKTFCFLYRLASCILLLYQWNRHIVPVRSKKIYLWEVVLDYFVKSITLMKQSRFQEIMRNED